MTFPPCLLFVSIFASNTAALQALSLHRGTQTTSPCPYFHYSLLPPTPVPSICLYLNGTSTEGGLKKDWQGVGFRSGTGERGKRFGNKKGEESKEQGEWITIFLRESNRGGFIIRIHFPERKIGEDICREENQLLTHSTCSSSPHITMNLSWQPP